MTWIINILIILAVLTVLLFAVFISNGDGKMIEVVYDFLSHYHDSKDKADRI